DRNRRLAAGVREAAHALQRERALDGGRRAAPPASRRFRAADRSPGGGAREARGGPRPSPAGEALPFGRELHPGAHSRRASRVRGAAAKWYIGPQLSWFT